MCLHSWVSKVKIQLSTWTTTKAWVYFCHIFHLLFVFLQRNGCKQHSEYDNACFTPSAAPPSIGAWGQTEANSSRSLWKEGKARDSKVPLCPLRRGSEMKEDFRPTGDRLRSEGQGCVISLHAVCQSSLKTERNKTRPGTKPCSLSLQRQRNSGGTLRLQQWCSKHWIIAQWHAHQNLPGHFPHTGTKAGRNLCF